MGLENHVDNVIQRDAPELLKCYYWEGDKLCCLFPVVTQRIMNVIDSSGEFGPLEYDEEEGKIIFTALGRHN